VGVQRLYTGLDLAVYHAPSDAVDFVSPSIWQVRTVNSSTHVTFTAVITDDGGSVARAVALYRPLSGRTWTRVELAIDPATGLAQGSAPAPGESFEYFVQAVDPTGNVALALDHGLPFRSLIAQFGSAIYQVDEAAGSAAITVTLDSAPSTAVWVGYAVGGGTARLGEDYLYATGVLTFSPGMTQAVALLPIVDDSLFELDETAILTLTQGTNAVPMSSLTATLTIVDDEAYPTVQFAAPDFIASESTGSAAISVTVTPVSVLTVSVGYATTGGTAIAGSDYLTATGTLTVAPGAASGRFTVPLISDILEEANETITVTLSSPVNANLGTPATATLTIVNTLTEIYLPLIRRDG
jgi:hypothetical protein